MEFFDLFNVPMIFMGEIINLVVKPDIQDVYDLFQRRLELLSVCRARGRWASISSCSSSAASASP